MESEVLPSLLGSSRRAMRSPISLSMVIIMEATWRRLLGGEGGDAGVVVVGGVVGPGFVGGGVCDVEEEGVGVVVVVGDELFGVVAEDGGDVLGWWVGVVAFVEVVGVFFDGVGFGAVGVDEGFADVAELVLVVGVVVEVVVAGHEFARAVPEAEELIDALVFGFGCRGGWGCFRWSRGAICRWLRWCSRGCGGGPRRCRFSRGIPSKSWSSRKWLLPTFSFPMRAW